ncbi:DUF4252 domain-containing protein [Algoriphagus sediminis]|uniref:DUF4252 domain-containing protein n=1 Tax=Algoriphagus sediminis TaxID=3057113 RepID=A0ABT7YEK0_9BACT|nr:DUF4252 domain-containing protein [Algoriphagus sediminis]MDN3204927.1 DUF4252 domain-containing protein [Algoriphagus sediminis]
MKKLTALVPVLLLLWAFQAKAQDDAIQKFFSNYTEDDRFSRVYISPKMMQMAGGFLKNNSEDDESKEVGSIISKIQGIRILSSDEVDGLKFYEDAMSTLTSNKYEELMDVKDRSSKLKFMVREENGLVKELLMVSGDQEDFALLSMLGSFTYEDLNILAETTEIPGMEEYRKGKNQP